MEQKAQDGFPPRSEIEPPPSTVLRGLDVSRIAARQAMSRRPLSPNLQRRRPAKAKLIHNPFKTSKRPRLKVDTKFSLHRAQPPMELPNHVITRPISASHSRSIEPFEYPSKSPSRHACNKDFVPEGDRQISMELKPRSDDGTTHHGAPFTHPYAQSKAPNERSDNQGFESFLLRPDWASQNPSTTRRPASSVYSQATQYAVEYHNPFADPPPVPTLPKEFQPSPALSGMVDFTQNAWSSSYTPVVDLVDEYNVTTRGIDPSPELNLKRLPGVSTETISSQNQFVDGHGPGESVRTLTLPKRDKEPKSAQRISRGWWNVITTPFEFSRSNSRRFSDSSNVTSRFPPIPYIPNLYSLSPAIARSATPDPRGCGHEVLENRTHSTSSRRTTLTEWNWDAASSASSHPRSATSGFNVPQASITGSSRNRIHVALADSHTTLETNRESPGSDRFSNDHQALDHSRMKGYSPSSESFRLKYPSRGGHISGHGGMAFGLTIPSKQIENRGDGMGNAATTTVNNNLVNNINLHVPEQSTAAEPWRFMNKNNTPPSYPNNDVLARSTDLPKSASCQGGFFGRLRSFLQRYKRAKQTRRAHHGASRKSGPKGEMVFDEKYETSSESKVKRKKRRKCICCCCFILLLLLAIIIGVILAVILSRRPRADPAPPTTQSRNDTGQPPMTSGIYTVQRPGKVADVSGCVLPTTLWSCALPKEDAIASNEADRPDFKIQISFGNGTITSLPQPSSTSAKRSLEKSSTRLLARALAILRSLHSRQAAPGSNTLPKPSPPDVQDQEFLGNTTDGNVEPFAGEETPFLISFLPNGQSNGDQPTSRAAKLQTRDDNPFSNITSIIPPPSVASDGTAGPANLLPFPSFQPVRIYNRGTIDEHYGFYTYFDRSIFLKSINGTSGSFGGNSADANGGSSKDSASLRCTWAQTRYLVQIWTNSKNSRTLLPSSPQSPLSSSASQNSTEPFPFPISITIDRHGGSLRDKMIYCYGIGTDGRIDSRRKTFSLEDRAFGGLAVNPAQGPFANVPVSRATGGPGGIDGGKGGCRCQWTNWSPGGR